MVLKLHISSLNNESTQNLADKEKKELVQKPKSTKFDKLHVDLHPLQDGIIVSVCPPAMPSGNIDHVPCDIILVIDVSGSMGDEAPVPTENPSEKERNGLTVLDLTKHAALTILESLDENDRMSVVAFSDDAQIIQELISMTKKNKSISRNRIEKLRPLGATNLWHGILKGIEISNKNPRSRSAAAMMVLTDGQPNRSCPAQGYVAKLRKYESHFPIHTFGFGYSIRSGLLKSIAEVSGGNFAFIPDAGMIGTVFVHAIAHLQSTFAKSATLTLLAPEGLKLSETIGDYVRKETKTYEENQLTVPLGNLQYGQSRDILIGHENSISVDQLPPSIHVMLQCQPLDQSLGRMSNFCSIHDDTNLTQDVISYHRSRSRICSFLSTIAPLSAMQEHMPLSRYSDDITTKQEELETLISSLLATQAQDQLNVSLMADLTGQIRLALSMQYFPIWATHFLLSIHGAHTKQLCNSFKDPGPLQYNKDSSLFKNCRDKLDLLFDTLPPPKPPVVLQGNGRYVRVPVSMSHYHNRDGACFAAESQVRLTNGKTVDVHALRKGLEVWTKNGGRRIAAVLGTTVKEMEMCKIGDLVITPWHPIWLDEEWTFPVWIANSRVSYTGVIYSLLMEPDQNSRGHVVEVDGYMATTMGHGVTVGGRNDIRAHSFFGNYDAVLGSLMGLPVKNGVFQCEGVVKDEESGLVSGFLRVAEGWKFAS